MNASPKYVANRTMYSKTWSESVSNPWSNIVLIIVGKIMATINIVEKRNERKANQMSSRSLLITAKLSFVSVQLLENAFIYFWFRISKIMKSNVAGDLE
jgi:hypothetical protein